VIREGTNKFTFAEEMTSYPEREIVKESLIVSLPKLRLTANGRTDSLSTIGSFNFIDTHRQHFVRTDIFEASIDSVDIGIRLAESVAQ
jgi:hypothetical protein